MTPVSLKQETRQLIFEGVGGRCRGNPRVNRGDSISDISPSWTLILLEGKGNSAYINIESSSLVVVNGLSASGVTFIMGVKSAY